MTQDFERAKAKLIEDSGGLAFTGFITNARMNRPPVVEGQIWQHARAEPSGRFADGHRIHTSYVAEIHIAGDSLWVVTETGSYYGILSFAPMGWRWFSEQMHETSDTPLAPLVVNHADPSYTPPLRKEPRAGRSAENVEAT